MNTEEKLAFIVENWDKIPASLKRSLTSDYNKLIALVPGLTEDGSTVIFLIDRQKPSIEADYSFDEERLAVNRFGQIIWGFDSGCSCPSPWWDNYPECYLEPAKSWKEFIVNLKDFDQTDLMEEIEMSLDKTISAIQKQEEMKNDTGTTGSS